MKILVTGAGGFVGQHLVKTLSSAHQIIGLDRKIPASTNQIQYIGADLLKKDELLQIIKKFTPDAIYHLAAKAIGWSNNPEEVIEVNVIGTINLYEAVLSLKSDYSPKIFYISSAEVYGKTDNPQKISETNFCNPSNFYAISKHTADRISYQYSQNRDLQILIIRPFNHTGPGQGPGFFVPDMISQIVKIEKDPKASKIFVGNLSSIRDYSDVRDVVRAYTLFLTKDFEAGEVFNICSGKGVKMEELLKMMLKLTTKKIEVVKDPDRLRSIDIPIYIGDNAKVSQFLGWKPEIPIEQTLKDTFEYWRSQV